MGRRRARSAPRSPGPPPLTFWGAILGLLLPAVPIALWLAAYLLQH